MMKLNPDQHVQVKEWLYKKGVQKCPACNSKEIYKGYQGPIEIEYTDNLNLNPIQITCPNCCYVMMFCLPSILNEIALEKQVGTDT